MSELYPADVSDLPLTEPELNRLHEDISAEISEEDAQIVVPKDTVQESLSILGFELTDDGYLIDVGTGDYATPHGFDRSPSESQDSEMWAPVQAVYYNSDVDPLEERMDDVDRIKLGDVYGFVPVDGRVVPVRDTWSNILEFRKATGTDLRIKTAWEESTGLFETMAYARPEE